MTYHHQSRLQPRPWAPTPLDATIGLGTISEFNTSESPRNKRVENWARTLLSPKAQEVHVPSWYTSYITALKNTEQDTPPSDSSSNATQQPTSRYNLRPRQNTVTSSRVRPATFKGRQVQSHKNKTKAARKSQNKIKNKTKHKGGKTNNNDNARNTEIPDSAVTTLMEPPHKRTKRYLGSITGSQSAAALTSAGGSSIWPDRSLQLINAQTATSRAPQTERFSEMQKLMNLESHSPQFEYRGSLPNDCPTSVVELCHRLQGAAFLRFNKIIPENFRDKILVDYPTECLPDSVWAPATSGSFGDMEFLDHYNRVKGLYNAMVACNGIGVGVEEVTWYNAIMNALGSFRSPKRLKVTGNRNDNHVNFDNIVKSLIMFSSQYGLCCSNLETIHCTTSEVINEYLPYDPVSMARTQSVRVDLLIGYGRQKEPLKNLLHKRPQWPFPFTPLRKLERGFLGAIPIEAKNASGDSMNARYKLALCSSALLRLRQKWATSQKKQYNADKPPVVVSLSVVGHVWSYYVMYLDKPRTIAGLPDANAHTTQDYHHLNMVPRILLGPFIAGHTTGLLPTFYLFKFFEVLREWLVEEWAPEIFEELAGIPVPVPVPVDVTSTTSISISDHV